MALLSALLVIRKLRSRVNPKDVSRLAQRCRKLMDEKLTKLFAAWLITRGKQLADSHKVDTTGYKEIDIVISSGGFRGQYALGVWSILRHWRDRVRVIRFAGSSAGAQCGLLMSADLIENWITFVFPWRSIIRERLFFPNAPGWCQLLQLFLLGGLKDLTRAILIAVYSPLSEKASTIDGVHMSCSELTKSGLKNYVISKYESFEELSQGLVATGGIPLFSCPLQGEQFRDRFFYDGHFTKPLPLFQDKKRPQLLIDLLELNIKGKFGCWSLLGPDPDLQRTLIQMGQDDIIRFFDGKPLPPCRQKVLRWV